VREILNGIFYVLSTGCQWQALPKNLPPKSTVWAYFDLWTWDGTLECIQHAFYVAVREQAGREQARPRRSSTARAPRGQKRGASLDPQGFDAGKKITGRKRHILVDTLGLLLSVAVHAANIATGWRSCSTAARVVCSDSLSASTATAVALDRRTHLCLAQPFPAPGTRFRALRQNPSRLHPPRHHAEAASCKPLVMNPNYADGL
jgi:transposase